MPYVTNNGVRIHYETAGQGPPIVLAHGGTGNSSTAQQEHPADERDDEPEIRSPYIVCNHHHDAEERFATIPVMYTADGLLYASNSKSMFFLFTSIEAAISIRPTPIAFARKRDSSMATVYSTTN